MNINYEEIAKEFDERMRTGREFEGFVRVEAKVAPDAGAIFSIRLSREEFECVAAAAKRRRLGIIEFMHKATLDAAESNVGTGPASRRTGRAKQATPSAPMADDKQTKLKRKTA